MQKKKKKKKHFIKYFEEVTDCTDWNDYKPQYLN